MKHCERLVGVCELMEEQGQDLKDLEQCLEELAWINRFLGGTRLIFRHVPRLLQGLPQPVRILDVATGYADIPRAIARWARERGIRVEIQAVDRHDQILELAARASQPFPEIRVRKADALALPYPDGSFDLVLASLVLHHMEGDGPERLLAEVHRVARRAVLVNDLRRGRWPLVVTWAALHLASRNRSIRHDGPISVRRGFVAAEMEALALRSGWKRPRVHRHPFFRLALLEKLGTATDFS